MEPVRGSSGESGIALVVTVLLLLLVSAIGISALNRAGDEKIVSTVSRRQVSNLSAAEAGLRLVQAQLENNTVGIPPDTALSRPGLFQDVSGLFTGVRSGTVDTATAQKIQPVGYTIPDGSEVRTGGGGAAPRLVYRVNVVASDPSGGNVQVQAQFSVRNTGPGF
jgi:Tfp pilus assembly protein PilX